MRDRIVPLYLIFVWTGLFVGVDARAGEPDCNNNGVPDATELSGNDCNGNGVLDVCENETLSNEVEFSAGSSFPRAPSFDLEGGVLVVGAPGESSGGLLRNGAVRIFRRIGDAWVLEQEIAGTVNNANFGAVVDISGDRIAVSAPGLLLPGGSQAGAFFIYLYEDVGGVWAQEDVIHDTVSSVSGGWGPRMALDGTRLVFSRFASQRPVAFDFYELDDGAWTRKQTIYNASPVGQPSNADLLRFGLSRDVFVTYEEVPSPEFGGTTSIAIFEWDRTGWKRVARCIFFADNLFPGIVGGLEVTSDRIVVAPHLAGAIVFQRTESGWAHEVTFNSLDLPSGVSYAGWSARLGERLFLGTLSNGVAGMAEIQFDQGEPYLEPMTDWAGLVGNGKFAGGHFGHIENGSQSILHLLDLAGDCNDDGLLDECAIAGEAPDVDQDRTPDDCEADCNLDGIPDDAQLIANDCNRNGVPDDCDIDPTDPDGDGVIAGDCNGNGVPDSCEPDCDENGVPDDCDLDESDPDGDGLVAADCNSNGILDACDIAGGVRELAQLKPLFLPSQDQFGVALAIEGEVIAVGANIVSGFARDSVYVYRQIGGEWIEEAVLTSESDNVDFGYDVDIANGRIFVAEFVLAGPNLRRIAIYERIAGEWVRTDTIVVAASSTVSGRFDAFGDEVVAHGPQPNIATLYRRINGSWEAVNSFSSLPQASFSGAGIAMNDEFVGVGGNGGVYVYRKDALPGSTFNALYRSVMPAASSVFSQPIAFGNGVMFVGNARGRYEFSNHSPGSADVFRSFSESGFGGLTTGWAPEAHFSAGPSEGDFQGFAVAAVDNRCFVASPLANGGKGLVRLYESNGPIWRERGVIASDFFGQPLQFGSHIAASDRYLAVSRGIGANNALSSAFDAVIVYAIDLDIDDNGVMDTCEPDCDGNLYPDDGERTIDGLVHALLQGGAVCVFDLNDDGLINGLDIGPLIEALTTAP